MATTSQTGRILVLIKPDAVERRLTGEILRRIEAKGYVLTALKVLAPTEEILAEHYAEHVDKPFYPVVVGGSVGQARSALLRTSLSGTRAPVRVTARV